MKNILIKTMIGLALVAIPQFAGAQALPFTAVEKGVASLAMAGADVVETGSTAYSAFGNTAAVAFSESKLDAAAGYTMWGPTGGNILNAAASFGLTEKLGVAAGFSYAMNPAYDIMGEGGVLSGQFTPSDMMLNAGVSYKILPILSVGANVGYASSTLAEGHSYGAVNADVFAMAKIKGLKAAVGISNIGSAVTSVSGAKFSLPTSLTVGAGYSAKFADKHAVDAQVDIDYYFEGALATALGAGYTFNDMVSLKAGYRVGGDSVLPSFASVGAGVKFMGLKLDVAYLIGSENMKNTLAVGLGFSF